MPSRKKTSKINSIKNGKPEKPELFLLLLPLLCLGLVLLTAVLTNNAASSKAPVAQAPTTNPASATRVTAVVHTPRIIPGPTATSIAITTGSADPVTIVPNASPTTIPPTPARTIKFDSPDGTGIRLSKTESGLKFDILVSPGRIGDNSYDLVLSENGNLAVSDASLVRLSVTSLDMNMGIARLDLKPTGADQPGLYSGLDDKLQMLSMFGKYKVEVLVQRPGQSDVTTFFEVSVTTK